MSLEDLCLAAVAAPRRSRPLQRRLRLLQSVLSRMPAAVSHTSNVTRRYEREFWTNFLNPCVAMELARWRFDLLHDAHDNLVGDVLKGLEEVVQMAEADIPEVRFTPTTSSLKLAGLAARSHMALTDVV
ncbi:hypothetical protein IMZ48_46500 [Candidatus Bathyarchaeota archaeon]|nr:hypothetical protein [Candidatus Bathyarchaeota archaeon]